MKHNTGKYREVSKLPEEALTPKLYAEQNGISHQLVYIRLKRAREKGLIIDFEIVTYQGVNFVVPYKSDVFAD